MFSNIFYSIEYSDNLINHNLLKLKKVVSKIFKLSRHHFLSVDKSLFKDVFNFILLIS